MIMNTLVHIIDDSERMTLLTRVINGYNQDKQLYNECFRLQKYVLGKIYDTQDKLRSAPICSVYLFLPLLALINMITPHIYLGLTCQKRGQKKRLCLDIYVQLVKT